MRPPQVSGSAHAGLGAWLVQRVTSLYLAGFAVFLLLRAGLEPESDFAVWRAWFGNGAVRVAWAIFFLSLLLHAWVGLRSIYMDYLHPPWLRFTASAVTAVALLALGLWAAEILWWVAA